MPGHAHAGVFLTGYGEAFNPDLILLWVRVFQLGETGTGQDCFARLIHELSDRSQKPMVIVKGCGIPSELEGSQLFAHKKGSFLRWPGRVGLASSPQGQ